MILQLIQHWRSEAALCRRRSPAAWRWHLLVMEEDSWAALWSQSVSMATEKWWKPCTTVWTINSWGGNSLSREHKELCFFSFFYILQILQQSILCSTSWYVQMWGWAVWSILKYSNFRYWWMVIRWHKSCFFLLVLKAALQ